MSESNESRHVGVIGLGNMGGALAETLLAKGHRVTVWNRTASKCAPLAEDGASVAASIPEAVVEAQTIVVCVLNHDASVSLLLSDEVARSLRGKTLVQLSTVTAEESRELGHWAEENGIAYLDGSILGYPQNVLNNDCTIIYSGPKSVFDANEGVFSAMGGNPTLVGETIGGAPTFDKTLYANHYGSLLAFFHGAAICHAAGFPMETYVKQVVASGAGAKPRFGEMLVKRSYESSGSRLENVPNAYAHVVRLSEDLGVDTTFAKTVSELFDRAIAEGYGQQELAAVFEVLLNKSA